MIGQFMKVYIDDVVINSSSMLDHFGHLSMTFERIRMHQLKINPLKYAFDVQARNFLGFLVSQKGIEINRNKARAIIEAKPP